MKRLIDGVSYNTDTANYSHAATMKATETITHAPSRVSFFKPVGVPFLSSRRSPSAKQTLVTAVARQLQKPDFRNAVKRLLDIGSPLAKLKSFSTPSKTK